MMGPIGPCRLCANHGELRDSHIIPSWCYERILHGPEGRQPQAILVDGRSGTQSYSNEQISEFLLCDDCEQLFSRWEKYVSGLLVQKDLSFPWLEAVADGEDERVVDAGEVDTETITRFMYSVVWRGSICSKLPASLGRTYEEEFADYLRGRSGVPKRTRATVKLLTSKQLQRQIIPPQCERVQSFHMHYFIACGALFQIFVGALIPAELAVVHFPERRVVVVGAGTEVKDVIAPGIRTYRRVGKLAKGAPV